MEFSIRFSSTYGLSNPSINKFGKRPHENIMEKRKEKKKRILDIPEKQLDAGSGLDEELKCYGAIGHDRTTQYMIAQNKGQIPVRIPY